MASKRQSVVAAVKALLEQIQPANGFQTEAGLHVFLGEVPELGPNDPSQAIAVELGEDELQVSDLTGRTLLMRMPLQLSALSRADLGNEAWLAIEAVLADVKRAMETDDATLGGLLDRGLDRGTTVTSDREPGSNTVGVSVTYFVNYTETWGAP